MRGSIMEPAMFVLCSLILKEWTTQKRAKTRPLCSRAVAVDEHEKEKSGWQRLISNISFFPCSPTTSLQSSPALVFRVIPSQP